MTNEVSLQKYIFNEIQQRLGKRADQVETLADILKVGKDAVYRRMRGDTILTPDEIALLARHFNISLDTFAFQKANSVMFTFNPFTHIVKSFDDYLSDIQSDLAVVSKIPSAHVFYASAEIPIFYYMFFPELIHFKFYVWGRTIWNFEYLQNKPFDFEIIPYPVYKQVETVLNLYRSLHTTELWSMNIMDSTLSQVEYHVSIGGFKNPKDAVTICKRLHELADHMQSMAQHGRKFILGSNSSSEGGTFNLYHNEMIYTNNTILVDTPFGKSVYATHTNPNFLKTSDERMCEYTDGWFKHVLA